MKIVHLLKGKADPNTMNGVNKVVHYLATYGRKAGLDVEVWGIANTPVIRHEHDYPLRLFSPFRWRFVPRSDFLKSLEVLPVNTIFHMHSVFLPELYVTSKLLRKRNIPWVLTPHGGYSLRSMENNAIPKRIYMQLFERWLISEAKIIHATTKEEANRIAEIRPSSIIRIVPNGQEIHQHSPRPSRWSVTQRPIFVFCGRLEQYHKGLDLLINGFAKYRRNGGRGTLWLIGDGPHKSLLERQVEAMDLKKSVEFLGSIFEDKKIRILKDADVFVLTSRWEGMPTAALEAASISLPIIVSQETGLSEFVREYGCGLVLPTDSPIAISEALKYAENAFTDGKLKNMAIAAEKMVREKFCWIEIVKQMAENIYQKAMVFAPGNRAV